MKNLTKTSIILLVICLDQISKYLILKFVSSDNPIEIIDGFFYLRKIFNTGIAFSFLKDNAVILGVISLLAVALLAVYVFFKKSEDHLLYDLGFLFIIGGGIGNAIDRFYRVGVVDFLSFGNFSVFNIADSFITIGCAIVILSLIIQILQSSEKWKK